MTEVTDELRAWLRGRKQAVLITTRADGSPQSSNVVFALDDSGDGARVSVTAQRAKTRNLARDPRAVLHVLGDGFSAYASIACAADVGQPTTTPGDEAGLTLLDYYNSVADAPHPDPDEFLASQVVEQRLLLRLRFVSATGWGWG